MYRIYNITDVPINAIKECIDPGKSILVEDNLYSGSIKALERCGLVSVEYVDLKKRKIEKNIEAPMIKTISSNLNIEKDFIIIETKVGEDLNEQSITSENTDGELYGNVAEGKKSSGADEKYNKKGKRK
jgi:hypothetical protein